MLPTPSNKDMTTETTITVTSDHNIFTLIHRRDIPGLQCALNNADDLNLRDLASQTPLMHAMFISDDLIRIQMIRLLLRHGCDVNAQDNLGRTALMHACVDVEKMEVVRQLVKSRSCDPNIYDSDGNTALMLCVWNSNSCAIKILTNHANVKNRLKVNVVNRSGHSALEMAIKLGLRDCCQILLKDGEADTSRIKYHGRLFLKSLEEKGGVCSNSSETSCFFTQSVVSRIMQSRGLCYQSSDRTVIFASSVWGRSLENAVQDKHHENDTSCEHHVQDSSTLSKPGCAQCSTCTTTATAFPESEPNQIQQKRHETHFTPEDKLCVKSGLGHEQETKPEPSASTELQTTSKSDTLSGSKCLKKQQHQSSYGIQTDKYFSRNLPESSSSCVSLHRPRLMRKNGVVHLKTEGEVHCGSVFWKRLPPLNRNGKSSVVTPMTTFSPLPQIPQGKIE